MEPKEHAFICAPMIASIILVVIGEIMPIPTAPDSYDYKTDLIGLSLNQDQASHAETKGHVAGNIVFTYGSTQGVQASKPEMFTYYRYKDEHGAVMDKLVPRDQVAIKEDLPKDSTSHIEVHVAYKREATRKEAFNSDFPLAVYKAKKDTPDPRPCLTKVESCTQDDAKRDDTDPQVTVHVPEGTIISTVDPNTIHKNDTAK
jgi:hypothetical protein